MAPASLDLEGLVPTIRLVACAFEVLLEGFLGWRNVLQCSRLLREELFSCVIHFRPLAGFVVQYNHKSF